MNNQQKLEHREFYTQLKLKLLEPGESFAGFRRPYTPVNKNLWTWDDAMASPDTPAVAQHRRYELTMWCAIGVH